MRDYIEEEKIKIQSILENKFNQKKFTVKFNGEFFIAVYMSEVKCDDLDEIFDSVIFEEQDGNKIFLKLQDEWLKNKISKVKSVPLNTDSLTIYSQVKRLDKQMEYNLTTDDWSLGAYDLARDILYMLHTKSYSIRANVVTKCAKSYNILQRKGKLPMQLVAGYKNALCQISKMM